MLFSSNHLVVKGEQTHTVVPYAHIVDVCVARGWGGERCGKPLVNMGPLKLFSSSVLIGSDPHSGSVYPDSGCLCYEGKERETPDNHGLSELFSSSPLLVTGELTHTVVLYAHTVVVCVVKGGGPLINMGPLKLFSSSFLKGIHPHSGSVYPRSGCVLFHTGKPL